MRCGSVLLSIGWRQNERRQFRQRKRCLPKREKPVFLTCGLAQAGQGGAEFSTAFSIPPIYQTAHLNHYPNFVDIMGEVVYMTNYVALQQQIKEATDTIEKLEQHLKTTTGTARGPIKSQINELQATLKHLTNVDLVKKSLLAEKEMDLEEQTQSIAKVFSHFTPENFEVTIVPKEGVKGVAFRGILDRKFLRLQPDYLGQIYEGAVAKKWTMVGEITHGLVQSDPLQNIDTQDSAEGNEQGMKEIVRSLIRHMSSIESSLHTSQNRIELRVRPLAIYQEMKVNISSPPND